MKISRVLRKVKLYKPARWLADRPLVYALKIKRLVYRYKLSRYKNAHPPQFYGPKVLVVMNFGGIGNIIEATPMVQALRALWPQAEITLLGSPGDLFVHWCVPDVMVDSVENLKGHRFDHTFFPYWEWTDTNGLNAPCDLGQLHFPRVWLKKWFLKPERQYYLDMIKSLGFQGPAPALYVSIKEPTEAIPPADLRICLVPGGKILSKWKYKRWPYYDKLVSLLLNKYPQAQICILGTQEDDWLGDLPSDSRILDLRSRLSLSETAWVLKTADIVIGNDCGPMHIADAVRAPSIIIFGMTCELKNAPQGKTAVISVDLPCRPCQYNDIISCPDCQCMLKISPDMVAKKIEMMLNNK